jgi:hypothetical protein
VSRSPVRTSTGFPVKEAGCRTRSCRPCTFCLGQQSGGERDELPTESVKRVERKPGAGPDHLLPREGVGRPPQAAFGDTPPQRCTLDLDLITVFGEHRGFGLNIAGRGGSNGDQCGDAVAVHLDKPVTERAGHRMHQQDDFAVELLDEASDRFADKFAGDIVWWDGRAATSARPVGDDDTIIMGEKPVRPAWPAVSSGE